MKRLDVTTVYESIVRALYYLLILAAGLGIFAATVGLLKGDGALTSESLVGLALCAPLTLAAGWAAATIDDTYWVDFKRRLLFFQKRGLVGVRLHIVKSFDELAAVSVDYCFERPPLAWHDFIGKARGPRHLYALALVARDGAVIRVSDLCVDGYAEISRRAAELSAQMGIQLLDEGPERTPVARGGYLKHQDQGRISSGYLALGLLLFVLSLVLSLTHSVNW